MIQEKIAKLAKCICREHGVELYDVELKNTDKGKILRVYITSGEGITMEDCSAVSRELSSELDIIDLIASKYYLEVSTPGLERKLSKDFHYHHAKGETVKVTYRKDSKTNTITGTLKEVLADGIIIELNDKQKTVTEKVLYQSIKKARTVFVMNHKPRR